MHVRVSQIKVQVDKVDEAVQLYRDSVLPALAEQEGFESAELLVQYESGRGISITRWESEEALVTSELSGFYHDQLAKFAGLFDVAPVRDAFEVGASS